MNARLNIKLPVECLNFSALSFFPPLFTEKTVWKKGGRDYFYIKWKSGKISINEHMHKNGKLIIINFSRACTGLEKPLTTFLFVSIRDGEKCLMKEEKEELGREMEEKFRSGKENKRWKMNYWSQCDLKSTLLMIMIAIWSVLFSWSHKKKKNYKYLQRIFMSNFLFLTFTHSPSHSLFHSCTRKTHFRKLHTFHVDFGGMTVGLVFNRLRMNSFMFQLTNSKFQSSRKCSRFKRELFTFMNFIRSCHDDEVFHTVCF